MADGNGAFEFSEEPPGVDERIRRFRLRDEVDTFAIRTERSAINFCIHPAWKWTRSASRSFIRPAGEARK